jgi:hypothetical protein
MRIEAHHALLPFQDRSHPMRFRRATLAADLKAARFVRERARGRRRTSTS